MVRRKPLKSCRTKNDLLITNIIQVMKKKPHIFSKRVFQLEICTCKESDTGRKGIAIIYIAHVPLPHQSEFIPTS